MKLNFSFGISTLFLLICLIGNLSGCKKDVCDGVVCLNNGQCNGEGECICMAGFSGENCQIADSTEPCQNVSCYNGGTCVNGVCFCPSGWTGDDCLTPIVSNPCTTVNCQNGGTCVNGTCNCPPGWTGAYCQTATGTNPCSNVNCQNGGACVNGTCNCPIGWTGTLCQTPANPSSITITKAEVLEFPPTDSGSSWDFWDGADMYLYLCSGGNCYETPRFENASDNVIHIYNNINYTVTNINGSISITAYDKDTDFDDVMASVTLNVNSLLDEKPASITLSNSSNSFSLKLYLTYAY